MKQKRQLRIIELINHNAIETQEELAEKLREEGFNVTQATVSRDIRELNLSKVPAAGGRQKYAILSGTGQLNDKYVRMMHDGLISLEPDAMHFPEIVGSIAGDDTIMAATKSFSDAVGLKNKINELIHE